MMYTQGNLKGESAVAAILLSVTEGSYCRLYPTSSTACTLIAALCWSVTTVKIMRPQMEQFNSWIIHHKATAGHFVSIGIHGVA